ncbi:MAG TPA: hypothetical protein VH120_16730 [Gemmataceae bacterium]|nr:hypothetical protein [Gemmataceae bacterium]
MNAETKLPLPTHKDLPDSDGVPKESVATKLRELGVDPDSV